MALDDLLVQPPVPPMLAKRVKGVANAEGWIFEPKWDGFRVLLFRSGDEWFLQSRDSKKLNRYFPELAEPILTQLPDRCVLDGELVIDTAGRLNFEALQQRIHPADSRVQMLANKTPASLVFWDLLCEGAEDLSAVPFETRRSRLEATLAKAAGPIYLTPATRDSDLAQQWFQHFEGAGLDGLVAKDPAGIYEPGKRVMRKIKHERTADCVVAGFRWHKKGPGTLVGSLMLGLYDDEGTLQSVGVAASFTNVRRAEMVAELAPLRATEDEDHPWRHWQQAMASGQRVPQAGSRWNPGKSLSWVPLRPELVVEVKYDHMQGRRFRHTTHLKRWRPDKPAAECTYEQLEVTPPLPLQEIFGS